MRSTLFNKILFSLAAILSLFAQGIVFAPAKNAFLLQHLPDWGNLTFGAILFPLSLFIFILTIRVLKLGTHTNWTLFAIHVVTVIGIHFLLDISASRAREAGFLFTAAITTLTAFGILANTPPTENKVPPTQIEVEDIIEEIESPVEQKPYIESNSRALNEQIASITRKLNTEKRRTTQLTFLNELSQQLESELDPPVAAQLAVNMLEHATECSIVSLLLHEQDKKEFVALATAGRSANVIPPGYRQSSEKGLMGRVARLKKTQLVNDTSVDTDFFPINNEKTLSEIMVPIMQNGQLKGIIEVCSEKPYGFSSVDVSIV